MIKHLLSSSLLLLATFPVATTGFSYSLVGAGELSLTDSETGIDSIRTLFTDEDIGVAVSGIEWEGGNNGTDTFLRWETAVGGTVQASGEYNLTELEERELLTDLDCGTVRVSGNGRKSITVTLSIDGAEASTGGEYEAFGPGAAIVPLLIVLFLALTTQVGREKVLVHTMKTP